MAETNNMKSMKNVADYVNEVCTAFLDPHGEFVSIACKYTSGGGGEGFIRVQTSSDEVHFYRIEGMNLEEVCEMVVKMVAGQPITREITDKAERKEVASLFR